MIEFGATTEADRVLAATKALPRLLDGRKKKVTEADIDTGLVSGSWKRLVLHFGSGSRGTGELRRRRPASRLRPRLVRTVT